MMRDMHFSVRGFTELMIYLYRQHTGVRITTLRDMQFLVFKLTELTISKC